MPSSESSAEIRCSACGCHWNFHRREPPSSSPRFTEYLPHHCHHPLPPPHIYGSRSPNSHSLLPISSSYYPASAPAHVLFSLSGASAPPSPPRGDTMSFGRKQIRTKFIQEHKVKMLGFAEKRHFQGRWWNSAARSVSRGIFKVWMHNHKNTSSFKRDLNLEFGNNGDKIGIPANGCSSFS